MSFIAAQESKGLGHGLDLQLTRGRALLVLLIHVCAALLKVGQELGVGLERGRGVLEVLLGLSVLLIGARESLCLGVCKRCACSNLLLLGCGIRFNQVGWLLRQA